MLSYTFINVFNGVKAPAFKQYIANRDFFEEYMKNTKKLTVFSNVSLAENEIMINPNDGLDIDLTYTKYYFRIKLNLKIENAMLTNYDYINGCIILDNNCKSGNIEFSPKLWKRIGKPENVILVHNEKEIFILNR